MGKTILFTPIGGTDPIGMKTVRDGSMLHICRWYQPDEVYMYLSKEMLQYQEEDDRYRFCLNALYQNMGKEVVLKEIERPELENVQEYDFFYNEFRSILNDMQEKMQPDDVLLLNVSSGTPAMKSGLLVLATMVEMNCKCIQVVTPEKGINEHVHTNYDVQTLWELNEDNLEGTENRCVEINCRSLSYIKQIEIIKRLVREYDYKAALSVCELLPTEYSDSIKDLIKVGYERLQLNYCGVQKIIDDYQVPGFEVKSGDIRKFYEYILSMEIKRKRGEYADFVRALSPIILDLFIMMLKRRANIDISEYISYRKEKGSRWNRKKLAGTEIDRVLQTEFDSYYDSPVYSSHIIVLIQNLCANDTALLGIVEPLRTVEREVRNLAAHQMVSINDEMIKSKTGLTALETCNLLKKAIGFCGQPIAKEQWDAYDTMNEFIISKINQAI